METPIISGLGANYNIQRVFTSLMFCRVIVMRRKRTRRRTIRRNVPLGLKSSRPREFRCAPNPRRTRRKPLSLVQRGGLTGCLSARRRTCLDTYQNFLKVALLLGWECDQSVFPVEIRTKSTTDVASDSVTICQYDQAARTLSSLGQPDDTRVVFRIGGFKLVWIAYIWSNTNAQYCGQICLECMNSEAPCSIEALSFDEFLIITAIAYTAKSNSPPLATVDNLACAHSKLIAKGVELTAEKALTTLYGNTGSSVLAEAAKEMSRSVLPGNSADNPRPCYFQDCSGHNSTTPWTRFWLIYYSGDKDDRHAATVGMMTQGREINPSLDDIRRSSERIYDSISSTSDKVSLARQLGISLGQDMIPLGNFTSVVAEKTAAAVVNVGRNFTGAGKAWMIQKLSHGLRAFASLITANMPAEGSNAVEIEVAINQSVSDVEDKLEESVGNRIAKKLEKLKKSVINSVAGFGTRYETIEDAKAALAQKADNANEKGEEIFVTSVKRLILLVDNHTEALQLFNSRACVAGSAGGQMPTSSAVNGPLVVLATANIVSNVSSVEAALDASIQNGDGSTKPNKESTLSNADIEAAIGKANIEVTAMETKLSICHAGLEDAKKRSRVIGQVMDVWKKDLEAYVGIIRSIGPALLKGEGGNTNAVRRRRDEYAKGVLSGVDKVIEALKETTCPVSGEPQEHTNQLEIERQEKEIKNNQLILAEQQAQLASNSDIIEHVSSTENPFLPALPTHSTSANSWITNRGNRVDDGSGRGSGSSGSSGSGSGSGNIVGDGRRTASSSSRTGRGNIVGDGRGTGSSNSGSALSWWGK